MPENAPFVDGRSLLLPDLPSGASGTAKAKPKTTRARKPRNPEPPPGSDQWWDRWLSRNNVPLRSNGQYDIWRCTSCGAPLIYAKLPGGRHGGPSTRMLDRRYGIAACWRVSEGGWKTVSVAPHGRGEPVLVRHDSRPQSEQPEQDSSVRHLIGGSLWSSVPSYGVPPGARRARFTKTISVGATVRVPAVEPAGTFVVISPASTVIDQPSSPDTPPSSPDEWSDS